MSWLLLALAATELRAEEPPPESKPLSGYIMPTVGFDTDDGLGFGFRAELQWNDPELSPYRQAVVLSSFTTLRGYHQYYGRYDRLGLGPQGQLRLRVTGGFRQWTNDQYYGIGQGVPREQAYLQDFDAEDPRRKRYRYVLRQPYVRAQARWQRPDGVQPYVAMAGRWSTVTAYADSLLQEHQPHGMDGGWTLQVIGGVLWDTRDHEQNTRSGFLLEVSGRWAPPLPGGAGHFGGPLLSARGFVPLGDRVVLGSRVTGEWLFGDIPFYEQVQWGGAQPIVGYGGYSSLRGLKYGRYRSPGKAVWNNEARIDVLRHTLLKRSMVWQVVPFVDVGTVWGADSVSAPAAGTVPVDLALGVGLHPVFDGAFVGRMDVGFGRDPVQQDDGSIDWQWSPGVYLTFEQLF